MIRQQLGFGVVVFRTARVAHSAVPLLQETVEAATRAMGADHPVALACRANLATARRLGSGGPVEGIDAVAGLRRVLGDGHPHTVLAEHGEWVELDVEPPPS